MNGFIFIFLVTIGSVESQVISLELEPAALLHRDQYIRRHRKLEVFEIYPNTTDSDPVSFSLPHMSFHPYTRGVYSSIVELDEHHWNETIYNTFVKEHNERVQEFNSKRHLSRYESLHRRKLSGNQTYIKDSKESIAEYKKKGDHRLLQNAANLRRPPLLDDGNDEINEQLIGGLYNDFQSAPLSQGYGTHYATVWVGTPTPQRKTLIVDTGSHHTAWPCKGCQDCGEDHHTDPYFDPDLSETFHVLQCHECRYESRCETFQFSEMEGADVDEMATAPENACVVRQSYTEGSSWTAYQARDMVFCGGKDVFSAADPVDARYATSFMFGCQMSSSGLFHSQLADGIMGLSQHEAALPRVMYDQGKLKHRLFSLCFRREAVVSKKGVSAGVLTLGGMDTRLDSSPMVYAKNLARTGWYTVFVKNVFLQKGSLSSDDRSSIIQIPIDTYSVNSDKGVIIDSGTTDSYLHKSMKQAFNEVWKQLTGKSYSNSPLRLTRAQLHDLPTIYIQIMAFNNEPDPDLTTPDDIVGLVGNLDPNAPNDVLLAIPALHYMEYSPSKDVYTPRFYFTESRGGVIGSNALQGHDVLFDWENGRIGFAESDCRVSQTRWEAEGLASEGSEARGQDCILKSPLISTPCFESVDASICTSNNEEEALFGVETIAMVVEYPGTTSGFGCEEVIKRNPSDFGDDLSEVQCNKSGLCTATRRCELTCQQFQDLETVVDGDIEDIKELSTDCGQGSWSACLESCSQSRVSSILMPDGKCYEVKNERSDRACHTEYCGISDPCLIPFVVHVILAFRGISADLWDKAAEDRIIDALSSSVKNGRGSKMFEPTDVEFLMTSPWFEEILDVSGTPSGDMAQVIGMKAVIEVHIYNPNAIKTTFYEDNMDANQQDLQQGVSLMFGRKPKASQQVSECRSSDLFGLAQKAHEIHFVLSSDGFMRQLVDSLQITDESILDSALGPLVINQDYKEESRVVSSWTIKTAVGGGSIYDHKLDPFPGAINYVHVSPAYLGLSRLTIIVTLILLVLAVRFLRRNRRQNKSKEGSNFILNLTSATFCPKPFEMVRGKLGTSGMKSKKPPRADNYEVVATDNDTDRQHRTVVKNSKCRSRLNDIISN